MDIWHWIVLLIYGLLLGIPAWRIAKKAGYAAPLGLLFLIPLVNVVIIWLFAFSRWPAESSF